MKRCSAKKFVIQPVDTGRKLNVLCTFNLRPASTGNVIKINYEKLYFSVEYLKNIFCNISFFLQIWFVFSMLGTNTYHTQTKLGTLCSCVFKTLSNNYFGAFCENSQGLTLIWVGFWGDLFSVRGGGKITLLSKTL